MSLNSIFKHFSKEKASNLDMNDLVLFKVHPGKGIVNLDPVYDSSYREEINSVAEWWKRKQSTARFLAKPRS